MKYKLYLLVKLFSLLYNNPRLLYNKLKHRLKSFSYKTLSKTQFIQLINSLDSQSITVVFNSVATGGAVNYLSNYIDTLTGTVVVIQSQNIFANSVVKLYNKQYNHYSTFRCKQVIDCLNSLSIKRVIVNHLLFTGDIKATLASILGLVNNSTADLIVIMHDYYYMCPSVNLINYRNEFCNLPLANVCNQCLAQFDKQSYAINYIKLNSVSSITAWRNQFNVLFSYAQEIILPSDYAAELFSRVYQQFSAKLVVIPPINRQETRVTANDSANQKLVTHSCNDGVVTIAILGEITPTKGSEIVYHMINLAVKNNLAINWVVIGEIIPRKTGLKTLKISGSYVLSELVNLVNVYKVDAFIIPSICPETYCYTADEVMQFNRPVFSFNIGAHAKRIASYKNGYIVNQISASAMLECITKQLLKVC